MWEVGNIGNTGVPDSSKSVRTVMTNLEVIHGLIVFIVSRRVLFSAVLSAEGVNSFAWYSKYLKRIINVLSTGSKMMLFVLSNINNNNIFSIVAI